MNTIQHIKQILAENGYNGSFEQVNGPDSRVGIDYWLTDGNTEVYANQDQDMLTVEVNGELIFQNNL